MGTMMRNQLVFLLPTHICLGNLDCFSSSMPFRSNTPLHTEPSPSFLGAQLFTECKPQESSSLFPTFLHAHCWSYHGGSSGCSSGYSCPGHQGHNGTLFKGESSFAPACPATAAKSPLLGAIGRQVTGPGQSEHYGLG